MQFVEERLLDGISKKVLLRDTLPKNKPLRSEAETVLDDYQESNPSRQNVLILSFKAGRNVDLSHILSYKLMPASPALAKTKGGSQSGQKSILSEVLIGDTP